MKEKSIKKIASFIKNTTNICYAHKYNWIVQLLFLSNETYIFFLNKDSGLYYIATFYLL